MQVVKTTLQAIVFVVLLTAKSRRGTWDSEANNGRGGVIYQDVSYASERLSMAGLVGLVVQCITL